MTGARTRKTETIVYIALWLTAIGLFLLDVMRYRAQMSMTLIDFGVIAEIARKMLPFFILFIVNNYLLIPKLLLRNRLVPYFFYTAIAVIVLWVVMYFIFMHQMATMPEHPRPHPDMRPLLPLPLFLDFIYALLVVGFNLAIALMFQRFDDRLEKESLMKANAENELAYLKSQIHPHFYMNMLNNIHGMIDIDPEKAQTMVISMSQLMRYMLYDSSKPRIPLTDEIAFLRNYLNLMRQRFPDSRVSISTHFPDDSEAKDIALPPLLFLMFIENAFKHGISYRKPSFIAIKIDLTADTLHFSCLNSNHPVDRTNNESTGIGLRNIRQRLHLLYGTQAVLDIAETPEVYTVNLTIPAHETQDHHN